MGVPAGATVTGITSASLYSKNIAYVVGSGSGCTCGTATLSDGTTTVTLASQRTITATDSNYVQQTGTNNTSLNWASNQSVTIIINQNLAGGNNSSGALDVYVDDLSFTITYLNYYTLTCNAGSYSYTGVSQDFDLARTIISNASSFTISSGGDATLTKESFSNESLTCNSGSYSVTGKTSGINNIGYLVPGIGIVNDYALYPGGLVQQPNVAESSGEYSLTCNVGNYSYTGISQDFDLTRKLICEVGTYTETGVSSDLLADRNITSNVGEFTLTGIDSNLTKDITIICQVGSYTFTGIDQTLLTDYEITSQVGSYTFTGIDVDLTKSTLGAWELICETGTYTYSGIDATFTKDTLLTCTVGEYTLSGITQTLLFDSTIVANPESYALSGITQTVLKDSILSGNTGEYSVTGIDSDLTYIPVSSTTYYYVIPEVGLVGLTGDTLVPGVLISPVPVAESGDYTLTCNSGSYQLTGIDIDLTATEVNHYSLTCNDGTYSITGVDVDLTATTLNHYTLVCNKRSFTVTGITGTLSKSGPITKYASSHTIITTGYTNPTNAYADDGSYATASFATNARNVEIAEYFGFAAFTELADNAVILSVTAEIQFYITSSSTVLIQGLQLFNNTTGIGTEQLNESEPSTDTLLTHQVTSGITVADLKAGNIRARVRSRKGNDNKNAATFYIDYVKLSVVYTEPKSLVCYTGNYNTNYFSSNLTKSNNWFLTCYTGIYNVTGISSNISASLYEDTYLVPGGLVTLSSSGLYPNIGIVQFVSQAAVGTYSLLCNKGTFNVTGNSAEIYSNRNDYLLEPLVGSFTVTGKNIDIYVERSIVYWVEFEVPLFYLETEPNSYAVTDVSATLNKNNPLLQCNKTEYFVSTVPAVTAYGYKLTCNVGEYTVTGVSTDLTYTSIKFVTGLTGYYNITGVSNSLYYGRSLSCETGSYTIEGTASFNLNRELNNIPSSYTVTGISAVLSSVEAYLESYNGTYITTGIGSILAKNRTLTCSTGSYNLTGNISSLSKEGVGAYELICVNYSAIVVEGIASLLTEPKLICNTGNILVTTYPASIGRGKEIVCNAGNFEVTEIDSILVKTNILYGDTGSITINMQGATLKSFGWAVVGEPVSGWTTQTEPSDLWQNKEESSEIWYNLH